MSRSIRLLIILGVVATVLIYVGWLTARAESQCGPIAHVKAFVMGRDYSEHALFDASVGCQRGECPVTIFGNADTGTGTIIVEVSPGFGCIFLGLNNLTPAKQVPQGKPL